MRRLLTSLTISALTLAAAASITLPDKTLCYEVSYHYGIIDVTAGNAYITLDLEGNRLTGTLNGHSIPIGRRIYAVSDTLTAVMAQGRGLSRENVTYENGWYAKPPASQPDIEFTNPANYKNINGGGQLNASAGTIEAITVSADMLALFYYFRQIDYSSLVPGQHIDLAINLPDGDVQQLLIVYEGEGCYKGHDTYKVSFTYSYHGTMSAYPVTAQIDRSTKLPLIFSSNIKIGHVELVLKQ